MKKLELVFVPLPAMGHLLSAVEFCKLLVGRDDRFSITVLIMKLPVDNSAVTNYINSDSFSDSFSGSIRLVHLPHLDMKPLEFPSPSAFFEIMEKQKLLVKDAVHQLMNRPETGRLAGIVVDSLCISMMDAVDELDVPSYVFVTSSAASLALMFHFQTQHDHHGVDLTEFADSDIEFVVPGFVNPVPARLLPARWMDKEGGGFIEMLDQARRCREAKGILVNTCMELEESYVIDSTTPPVYTVGPLLNLNRGDPNQMIIRWLDDQPPSSVVFLCFGGGSGAFNKDQIKEIANGLENSGFRFLWALRRPPPKGLFALPTDYVNFEGVMPEGFLDRTSRIGKIIGWAPQVTILSHPAIGGFVSHCGWNSILESIWFGVPIAAWPMFAEQQFNAFQLVREFEIGVELKLDYNMETKTDLINAQEIESAIRLLMDDCNNIRLNMTYMKEKCKKALMEGGGSSNSNLQRLISDMIANTS